MNSERPSREQLVLLAKTDPEAIADLVLMLWDRVEALEAKVAQLERNSRSSSTTLTDLHFTIDRILPATTEAAITRLEDFRSLTSPKPSV